jgi:hypothetical protein
MLKMGFHDNPFNLSAWANTAGKKPSDNGAENSRADLQVGMDNYASLNDSTSVSTTAPNNYAFGAFNGADYIDDESQSIGIIGQCQGKTKGGIGVAGVSRDGCGVYGLSRSQDTESIGDLVGQHIGVLGDSRSGFGVLGRSVSGIGVRAMRGSW